VRLARAALALSLAAAAPALAAAPAEVERGRAVYNFRCYFCHGYSGDARTLAATFLKTPPRNFQATPASALPLERIAAAVRDGVPGTSMQPFRGILGEADIAAVAAFVDSEFLEKRAPNTRYHTPENGWNGHERHAAAFPFARGDIPLDRDEASLTPREREGRRLFLATCITCHDRAKATDSGPVWERR